jgi:hypothetical protein
MKDVVSFGDIFENKSSSAVGHCRLDAFIKVDNAFFDRGAVFR